MDTNQQTSALQISTIDTGNYQIAVNELYDYPNTNPIIHLKSCPQVSTVRSIESAWSSGDVFTFTDTFSANQYLSNAMKIRFQIPLVFRVDPTVQNTVNIPITEANFMQLVMNDNADVAYSYLGLIQGIKNITTTLNGVDISNVNNVAESLNMVAQYYSEADMDQFFQASQPDRYQSFDSYTGANGSVSYTNEDGVKVHTSRSVEQENNIFGSKHAKGYVSRTPEWQFRTVASNPDVSQYCYVTCSFFIYLPLSFTSIPSKMTTFTGVHDLTVTVNMLPDLASRIFNLNTTSSDRIKDIALDSVSYAASKARIHYQLFTAPAALNADTIDLSTGNLKPYKIQVPNLVFKRGNTMHVKANETFDFNFADISTNVVPTSVYIGIAKKKTGNWKKCSTTPINYGLLRNLSVSVDTAVTNFQSTSVLATIADSNGYDVLDPIGRIMNGFAVKLNLGKDLSMGGTTVCGANSIFRIGFQGSFINQGPADGDYEVQVLLALPSTIDFNGETFSRSSGVLVPKELLTQDYFYRAASYKYGRRIDMGAGFMRNAFNKIKDVAKSAWKNRDQLAGLVGTAVKTARLLSGGERQYSTVSGAGFDQTPTMGAGNVHTTSFYSKGKKSTFK